MATDTFTRDMQPHPSQHHLSMETHLLRPPLLYHPHTLHSLQYHVPLILLSHYKHRAYQFLQNMANLQKDIINIEREWETVWEVFPELYQNIIREPAIIPPSSSSTSHTNTSIICHTIPPIACIMNSYTHPHTTDHLHHTNTTTSTTTSITILSPIIFPKQPRLKKTKSARTISTVSPTTTSTTTSITTSAPTIFPRKSRSKKTKQSTQITIPKRHIPTLSAFISSNIRLKHYKKSPLPFEHHRTSCTTHPATSSTSTATTTKNPPNTKISTTPEQSTSIALLYNTPTTIINTTTPTTTINTTTPTAPTTIINTTTPTATINKTTTTQTEIPPPMEPNISVPPRLRIPSTSLAIPLPSSTPPSLIFPHTLQELQ